MTKLNQPDDEVKKSFQRHGLTHILIKSTGGHDENKRRNSCCQNSDHSERREVCRRPEEGAGESCECKGQRKAGIVWLIKSHVKATSFVNDRGTRMNRRAYDDKRTRKQDDRQLGFDFTFRPTTSESDKADSISLGKRTTAMLLRRCGGTVLANGVCDEVTRRGTVSLVGQRVTSPKELAALAQVFRNPNYETLRYFFTKGDEIVGQTRVSSSGKKGRPHGAGKDGRPHVGARLCPHYGFAIQHNKKVCHSRGFNREYGAVFKTVSPMSASRLHLHLLTCRIQAISWNINPRKVFKQVVIPE